MKRWWWIIAIAAGAVLAVASARISGLPEVVRIALSAGALSLAGLVATVTFPEAAHDARLALRRRRRRGASFLLLRDEARLRVFWRVAVDFDGGGWARGEVETLRLIVRNLEVWRPLGARLANRLAPVVHRVLADVLDRADDMARCGMELDLDPDAIDTVQRGIEELAQHLGDGRCVEGRPVPFDVRSVAFGADHLLDGCTRLLDAVRPSVACEPLVLLGGLAGDLASRAREVEVDTRSVESMGRVGVRGRDLGDALTMLLGAGEADERLSVCIEGRAADKTASLIITWRNASGRPAAPSAQTDDALRPLRCFGARWSVEESEGRLTLILPRYQPATARPAGRGGPGPLSSPAARRRESGT